MRYTLDNCELYRILKKRDKNSDMYCGILKAIETPVDNLLQFIRVNYPSYTDHSIAHSFRILNYLFGIFNDDIINDLSNVEIFCLILSSFFHDIGMSRYDEDDLIKLREEHDLFSEDKIREFFDELSFIDNKERLVNCVVFACKSHNRDLEEFYYDVQINKIDTINGEKLRYGYIAILLRIGDLLDMEEDRTCYMVRKLFPLYYSQNDSDNHHKRHMEIDTYEYDNEKIKITVYSKSRENYKIWSNWFKYLQNDILWANTKYFRKNVSVGTLPEFKYRLEPDKNSNFSTEEIKFEIDDAGMLWSIISKSIYTNEFDFLRELLQNSIDACLLVYYLDKNNNIISSYQRNWKTDSQIIYIAFSSRNKKMYILDNGIGMGFNELKNFLFKTADSGYKHLKQRDEFLFPAIAKFGIGFVACLTKADNIKIHTQSCISDEEIIAEIEKNSNIAFLERKSKYQTTGTMIELTLSNTYSFNEIKKYLDDYFLYQCIEIQLINLDSYIDIKKQIDSKYDFCKIDFRNCINDIDCFQEQFQDDNRIILNVDKIKSCISIIFDLVGNLMGDDLYPIKDIVIQHNYILEVLDDLAIRLKTIGVRIELEKNKIQKFNSHNIEIKQNDYFAILNKLNEKMNDVKSFITQKKPSLKKLKYEIGKKSGPNIWDEEVAIIYLDDMMKIENISYSLDDNEINNKKGIIIIRTFFNDEKSGIEYDGVSTFLFDSGELVDSIGKVYVRSENKELYEKVLSFEKGIQDLEYEIECGFEEEIDILNYNNAVMGKNSDELDYVVDLIYCDGDVRLIKGIDPKMHYENYKNKSYSFFEDLSYGPNFEGIPKFGKSIFSQDGIRINVDLSELIPFKVNVFRLNLLGESRFDLNITRHDINEDRVLISKWIDSYGSIIQKNIIGNLKEVFEKCGFRSIDWDVLLKKSNSNYFDECAFENFEELLK